MRLLDLFCGAGGCSVGYHRAGFEVVGVDINPQPNYPYKFWQHDALAFLQLDPPQDIASNFDAVHASPPCQAYTTMSTRWRGSGGAADDHADLISVTRERLKATGLLYVIENVPGAAKDLEAPYTLNGGMFGLGVDRPRLFETNFPLLIPQQQRVDDPIGVYGAMDGRRLFTRADGTEQRAAKTLERAQEAMGIDWMEWNELKEAIPPAYTELIGHQLMQHLQRNAALTEGNRG